jgi:hypothetical protein
VAIYAELIEVWYGQQQIHRLLRLSGHGKHYINYPSITDSRVRNPGAFENYRYREELLPARYFQMADDLLRRPDRRRAHKEYLKVLYLAAKENESGVNEALRWLIEREQPIVATTVQERLGFSPATAPSPSVSVGRSIWPWMMSCPTRGGLPR